MKENTKDRILKFITSQGITKTHFLEKIQIKRGFLDKDKMKAAVSDHALSKIYAIYPNINLEWLITGKGEMLKNYSYGNGYANIHIDDNLQRTVPLYSLSDITNSEHPMYDEGKRPNTITLPHMPLCDAAVYMYGDSMYPIIKTGDIVCFKYMHDFNNIYWGEMYILEILREEGNHISVKYIQKSTLGENYVTLHSFNKIYPPQDVLKEKILKLGLIKACVRYNTLV